MADRLTERLADEPTLVGPDGKTIQVADAPQNTVPAAYSRTEHAAWRGYGGGVMDGTIARLRAMTFNQRQLSGD